MVASRRLFASPVFAPLVVLGLGLSMTTAFFFVAQERARDRAWSRATHEATVRADAVLRTVNEALQALQLVNQTIQMFSPLHRKEFQAAVDPLLRRYAFIENISLASSSHSDADPAFHPGAMVAAIAMQGSARGGIAFDIPVYGQTHPARGGRQDDQAAWRMFGKMSVRLNTEMLVAESLRAANLTEDGRFDVDIHVDSAMQSPLEKNGWHGMHDESRPHASRAFMITGIPWQVQVRSLAPPAPAVFAGSATILAGGTLLSLAIAAMAWRIAACRRRVHRMEEERAVLLEEANSGLLRDLAARQKAEQDLRHAQHVLMVAQKVAHLGSWELDGNTCTMRCSDELFRIFGLEPQSVTPTLEFILSFIHPDDRNAALDAIVATRDEGKEFHTRIRIVRPDGSIRHVISVGEATRNEDQWVVKVIGSLLDVTELKETEIALRTSKDQLRQLVAYQEHIREEERKHIARDIHDELGGLLTGIRAYLSVAIERASLAGEKPDSLLEEARQLTDQASETARRVVTELRPSVLDQLGIWDALQWYAEQTAKRTGMACECDIGNAAASTRIGPRRSIAIFRIVQEALTNVARHARATYAEIRAVRQGVDILLEIADNGQGFDTDTPAGKTAWGIAGMRERAHHCGGTLEISSHPDKGTVVRLRLPVNTSIDQQHD